ncbi:MAG: histidine phosphatase family protein [Acidimicrobiales bacterium]|nr:histidine phosphatase family protein [Acidimicrobiales bacterium]
MTIYLVRHGHAGSRSHWSGDDDQRPLSPKGIRQAEYLVDLLGHSGITAICSSPSVRCTQTVTPLARKLGLDITECSELAEGTEPEEALALLFRQAHIAAPGNVVLCSHGDVIPRVIRRLTANGMRTTDPNIAQKGSVWELDYDGEVITAGRYLLPGT